MLGVLRGESNTIKGIHHQYVLYLSYPIYKLHFQSFHTIQSKTTSRAIMHEYIGQNYIAILPNKFSVPGYKIKKSQAEREGTFG